MQCPYWCFLHWIFIFIILNLTLCKSYVAQLLLACPTLIQTWFPFSGQQFVSLGGLLGVGSARVLQPLIWNLQVLLLLFSSTASLFVLLVPWTSLNLPFSNKISPNVHPHSKPTHWSVHSPKRFSFHSV